MIEIKQNIRKRNPQPAGGVPASISLLRQERAIPVCRRVVLFCALGLLIVSGFPLFAAPALTGVDLLKRIDSLVSFPEGDFSAEYVMTIKKPGEGSSTTNFVIFRRDAEEKYLILILSPPQDKGKGYLKIKNDLWFYDPADRRFTYTSAKDRFQNSNARNSDFTRSTFAQDYRITKSWQEKLGKFDCTVLDMEALSEEVTFPRTILWVDNEDLLVRKKEDYSLSNQLLRTTAIPTYQRFSNRFVPVTILMVDHLRGRVLDGKFVNETTHLTISRPSLEKQPDSLYTKGYLERLGR